MLKNHVHGLGFVVVAVLVGLIAGCLLGTQPSINGQLARHLEHPLQATLISFATGTMLILVLLVVSGLFPPAFNTPPRTLPWWIWLGGAIGVVMVTTSLLMVPRVGSLPWFAAVMTGQTLAALVLDHFGLLGNPKAPMSPLRLIGAVLLICGILAIVQAKRLDQQAMSQHASQDSAEADGDAGKVNSEL